MSKGLFKNLKFDLLPGLVVFLVVLFLCFWIASPGGAPFFSGILSGLVGGIVIASLSDFALGFGAGVWKSKKLLRAYQDKIVLQSSSQQINLIGQQCYFFNYIKTASYER